MTRPPFVKVIYHLPVPGVIRGGGGLKQIRLPAGTKVWAIGYGLRYYHYGFTNEADCVEAISALDSSTIPHNTLVEWNFSSLVPTRIARPKKALPAHHF